MACITINMPPALTAAQGLLSQATDTMAAISGESCNIFGALNLGDVDKGIQDILGVVGNAMGAVNDAIAQVQQLLNSVIDTALGAINQIIGQITNSINQIANYAQGAINSITGLIDQAIGVLVEKAKLSEILACVGVVGQLGAFPPNVTQQLNQMTGLLNGGTPVRDIANQMVAGAKDQLVGNINSTVGGIIGSAGSQVGTASGLISVNVDALSKFSCVA